MVTLRLLGNLAAANGERVLEWELKEPTTLRQFIRMWKDTECMFTVGFRIAAESTVVKDSDIVKVTPHSTELHSADFPIGHGGTT